ncbi:alkaline-phosphatase-like protein [Zopfochytrium polystomum]|nr:alkaline-phosphatase-like protein [Zopfochytrium polystomum]
MLVVVVSISVGVSLAPPDSDASSDNSSYDPTVILVSIDGFRNDYLSRGLTPNIADLADAGVQADYLRPAFPSVTFPNHYTLVTGLWPADHGIVANTFFDSELNDTFVYVDPKSNVQSKWWGGEPIWVTAVKQGQRSATCMWPGSEAPITKDHVRPTYWLAYDHNLPLTDRVGHIFKWLDLPRKDRPTLLTLYAADVDSAGHTFGPDSLEVNASLARVDAMVGMLIDGIRKRNLASSVNLVVVSDHGMATVKDFIFLDDYVDISKVRLWNSLLVGIEPVDSKDKDEILRNLTIASNATGLFKVWEKANVPARFHYSHGPRIASIQLLPELVSFLTKQQGITATTRQLHDAAAPPKGMHGYDNTLPEMQAIFIAAGPKFAPSRWSSIRRIPGFDNVQVYNLLAKILGLSPAPNNGTHASGRLGLPAGGGDPFLDWLAGVAAA